MESTGNGVAQPLFMTSHPRVNSSTFPQLSRVLVSFRETRTDGGVRIGYAPTLAEALDQVFGPGTGRVATAPGGDAAQAPPPATGLPDGPPPAAPVTPPVAVPAPPGEAPMTAAELREALADLREVLGRLENAIDAYETTGR